MPSNRLTAANPTSTSQPPFPPFNQVVLLLHGDGTNGAQNNTFLDDSTNNFTITRNGNTTQGTFSPFSQPDGRWSNFFDGTNDQLTIADNAALRPGTSNFTIEAWVYRAAAGAAHTIFAKGASTPTGFAFLITSSNTLRFTDTSTDITSTGTVAANQWVHVAVCREGTGSNQLKLYINGVQDGTGTSSTNFNQTEEARIGENRGATDDFNGYISNFRYVIGTALYTTGFTPSTSPLTTTSQGATLSEVELLTCQSNRFVDNSTNAFAITINGDARVTAFSPFLPAAAYSTTTNGGSGYFDGTGDYLSVADNANLRLGTDPFTIEAWVYRSVNGVNTAVAGKGATIPSSVGWTFTVLSTNALRFINVATTLDTTATVPANQWVHVAVVREGTGTNQFKMYINGVLAFTGTVSTNFNDTNILYVGATRLAGNPMNGYLANVRIVKGTAVYTSNFTPPTAPLTAITNTQLLCNFTNAGIIDNTGKTVLETVGDAKIDTTTKKFGTGAIYFDGTADALYLPNSTELDFGTGPFTIEGWMRTDSTDVFSTLFSRNTGGVGVLEIGNPTTSNRIGFVISGQSEITSSTTNVNNGSWHHFACVRNGANAYIFINGTQEASTSSWSTSAVASLSLGRIGRWQGNNLTDNNFRGWLDDIRITKGVARYTANFTPPTKEFEGR